MEKNYSLGERLIDGMNHIPFDRWRDIVWVSFQEYKKEIWSDSSDRWNPWYSFLDFVASKFGYYGDLDLHIETMEVRLHKLLSDMKSKDDANKFIIECGDHIEAQERMHKELAEHYGFSVIEA